MLSFGKLTWKYEDIVYIAVKDLQNQRGTVTAQNEVDDLSRRNMARISVLMPVYNVKDYIAEALASIQSQTFTDIEIVIVDDGSTDGTLQIVEHIASLDPRIIIVRVPRNLGLTFALNIGLPFCHAPFIARMDGDDIALPTRLEKQLKFLEENPGVALVGCASIQIDQTGRPIAGLRIARKPAEKDIAKIILLNTPCLHIWLARRELYDKLDGYREMRYSEDYDFLLRAWTAGFRLSNLDEPLMQIRSWPGNTSSCLETRKAHYYIRRLCRERMKNGCDSFSKEEYDLAVKPGKLENFLFHLAYKCAQRGLLVQHSIKPFVYIPIAAMLSTWQARYYFDSIRLKLAWPESMRST
jgi:glycosyltransferase involved in cell wall biosynthesis